MSEQDRKELVTRATMLNLLSDEETNRVSTAESQSALAVGSDYIDLDHLDKGVQRVSAAMPVAMHNIVPRAAVGRETWDKMLAHLAP